MNVPDNLGDEGVELTESEARNLHALAQRRMNFYKDGASYVAFGGPRFGRMSIEPADGDVVTPTLMFSVNSDCRRVAGLKGNGLPDHLSPLDFLRNFLSEIDATS